MITMLNRNLFRQFPALSYGFLLTAFCGLLYGCLIRPLRLELNDLKDSIAGLGVELDREEMEESRLERSNARVAVEETHLNQLIPRLQGPSIDLLRALQKLATSNRLELSWHEPQTAKAEQFWSYRLLTIELAGNYHNLRRYFEGVSELDHILSIDSYEIEATGESTECASSLKAKIVLNVPKHTNPSTGTPE